MSRQFNSPISWSQRLRSARNALSLRLSERIRFSLGPRAEVPCLALPASPPARAARIRRLAARYGTAFESLLGATTSLNNYAYLDLLDRAFEAHACPPPHGLDLSDVGCANFWYASALQVFFRPRRLDGYEVEGYRRYLNGRTRWDDARGYAGAWPNTAFHLADYCQIAAPAQLITCWFPFVSAAPLLAWGLPLKLLKPQDLFRRIAANLAPSGSSGGHPPPGEAPAGGWPPGGMLFMVNHGESEAAAATELAQTVGLRRRWVWTESDPLLPRPRKLVASYWQR